jgi:beta-lactamase class C
LAGAFGLWAAVTERPAEQYAVAAKQHLKLASVSTANRRDVDYSALDARLKRLIERPGMVGLSVGIVENGRITFLAGYGETLAGSGEKVTPQTVFRWASVSKGVAGTMVAKLAEQGKINLQAPVAQYSASLKLPGGNENRATVADLLSHRLGLYRNAYDNKLEEGQDPAFLRSTLGQLNAICAPGQCWSYQNVAYDASSEIVSRVTGESYARAVKEQLFDPIGMTSASVTRDGLIHSPSWARPHTVGRRPLEVLDFYYRIPAAGGVNSSIKDMALWMVAQAGAMPDVLSPRLLQTIHAPLVKTPSEQGRLRKFTERLSDPEYGFGWRSYDYAGHRIVGHRGGVAGYRSLILFDPQLKSGVVALWNSNAGQPGGLEFEVMDMLYHLPFRDWLELDQGHQTRPAAPDAGADIAAASTRDGGRVVARYAAATRKTELRKSRPSA